MPLSHSKPRGKLALINSHLRQKEKKFACHLTILKETKHNKPTLSSLDDGVLPLLGSRERDPCAIEHLIHCLSHSGFNKLALSHDKGLTVCVLNANCDLISGDWWLVAEGEGNNNNNCQSNYFQFGSPLLLTPCRQCMIIMMMSSRLLARERERERRLLMPHHHRASASSASSPLLKQPFITHLIMPALAPVLVRPRK